MLKDDSECSDMQKCLDFIFCKYKVDIYVCGYIYNFQYFCVLGSDIDYVVNLVGLLSCKVKLVEGILFCSFELGFFIFMVDKKELDMYMIDKKGKVIYIVKCIKQGQLFQGKRVYLWYKIVNVFFVMLNIFFLIGGLVFILVGVNGLMDGFVVVVKCFCIFDLVIGFIIVVFGILVFELVISVFFVLNGSVEMVIGNVVGSNIFNVLMIIGCIVLVFFIKVGEGMMSKEILLVIFFLLVFFVCVNDMMLDREVVNVISCFDGFVLLVFFFIFMCYIFVIVCNGVDEVGEEQKIKEMFVWKLVLYIVGGLVGFIFGGQFFVDGVSGFVCLWGVSELVIGLILVVGGIFLLEFVIFVMVVLKKNLGIVIGNVIGSNLFNIFFVLGCSVMVLLFLMGNINNFDLSVLIVFFLLLWLVGWFFCKCIIIWFEGVLMVGCYVVYIVYFIV